MFEVFNCSTGKVVQHCKDAKEAHIAKQQQELAHVWIDGTKFSFRSMDESDSRELKRRQQARRVRARGGKLHRVDRFRFAG